MSRIGKSYSFYRTVKDEYFSGPRRKLEDGSIELQGKRWGLAAMILVPAVLVLLSALELMSTLTLENRLIVIHAFIGVFVYGILLAILSLVMIIGVPRRRILMEANLGSVLIEHRGLTRRKDLVVNLEEIEDVNVLEPPRQGPLKRPRIYLKTKNEELYLVSVGRYYANKDLHSEIETMVGGWNQKR